MSAVIPTIPVLFEDDDFLAVEKPADLLTTPGRGPDKQDCLITRILLSYPNARIVHRLDMATSGIVILALNHKAQAAMGKLFEHRQIKKEYIAIVDGQLSEKEGDIELPLICDWPNRPKQKVCFENGKAAYTRFTLLNYDASLDCSSVKLEPHTGRSHQLRVHMLEIGHPILGDYFYGSDRTRAKSDRLLLHAHQLSFAHPFTHTPINIVSTVPFKESLLS
ncbi:MAG: pseudouridine synthase [Cellvibrionaceae bacterium]